MQETPQALERPQAKDARCCAFSEHCRRPAVRLKTFSAVPILPCMIDAISSTNANIANQVKQQAARQPQPSAQPPTKTAVLQDRVTLKSTGDLAAGDADHDGK